MDTIKKIIAPLAIGIVVGLLLGNHMVSKQVSNQVGAVSSPDIMSPYFSFGGVRNWGAHTDSMHTATSTVCVIQSPVATSTLLSASMRLDTGSTSASTLRISKATTAFATTTTLASSALAANLGGIITATTSIASDNAVVNPSNYIVFSMEGGTGVFSPTGSCQATFEQI